MLLGTGKHHYHRVRSSGRGRAEWSSGSRGSGGNGGVSGRDYINAATSIIMLQKMDGSYPHLSADKAREYFNEVFNVLSNTVKHYEISTLNNKLDQMIQAQHAALSTQSPPQRRSPQSLPQGHIIQGHALKSLPPWQKGVPYSPAVHEVVVQGSPPRGLSPRGLGRGGSPPQEAPPQGTRVTPILSSPPLGQPLPRTLTFSQHLESNPFFPEYKMFVDKHIERNKIYARSHPNKRFIPESAEHFEKFLRKDIRQFPNIIFIPQNDGEYEMFLENTMSTIPPQDLNKLLADTDKSIINLNSYVQQGLRIPSPKDWKV